MDWHATVDHFHPERSHIHLVDYSVEPGLGPRAAPLQGWGAALTRWMKQREIPPEQTVIIGYSQGGRLALQAQKVCPFLKGLILISVNPGLPNEDRLARRQRAIQDEAWARRFESEPWEKVLEDWNKQSVFEGSSCEPLRPGGAQEGLEAAAMLRAWSLSSQEDMGLLLRENAERIHWVVGDLDSKYKDLWMTLASGEVPGPRGTIIGESGHRILFDQPELLRDELLLLLDEKFR